MSDKTGNLKNAITQTTVELRAIHRTNKLHKKEGKQRPEAKYGKKNDIIRLAAVGLVFILELTLIVFVFLWLGNMAVWVNITFRILAVIFSLFVFIRPINASFKFPWIFLILFFPILGVTCYFLLGNRFSKYSVKKKYGKIDKALNHYIAQDSVIASSLEKQDLRIAHQLEYPYNTLGKYPFFNNTDITYFKEAKDAYRSQLNDLRRARHFIFIEYFAIEDKETFAPLKAILAQKVKEGVQVRIFYDNVGSLWFVNRSFLLELRELGIEARVFNPLSTFWKVFMNNRDHRKITVIDGRIGYTGGYNLANEYMGITHPYGHWKDNGIRLEGKAVNSLTLTFLENWNAIKAEDEDFARFINITPYEAREKDTYVVPYACSPIDEMSVGEGVYMNLLRNAKRYVYFSTPYLVLTDEMVSEMISAVKRGIDVRIVTPRIPDKKFVFKVTRSYYHELIKGGVRIYEYRPGFIHAKTSLADDELATVGSINLDYRSFYLNFENGVLFTGSSSLKNIKEDFSHLFESGEEITLNNKHAKHSYRLLRLIAPLL